MLEQAGRISRSRTAQWRSSSLQVEPRRRRVFDAPRELVHRAFTDPDQVAQWFGPVGYSVPRDTVDVDTRAGRCRRFTIVNDADPTETSPVNAIFTEVIENELLAGHEQFEMPGLQEPTLMSMQLEFDATGVHDEGEGNTRLVLRQGPDSIEMEPMAREGWRSSFTKLATLLAG